MAKETVLVGVSVIVQLSRQLTFMLDYGDYGVYRIQSAAHCPLTGL